MAVTIDLESKRRIRMPIDLDFLGVRYKTDNGYFTFPSPSLWTIEKNLFYLLRNSVVKEFDAKYKMRPDYLSFDEYGTVILAPVLMYLNGVPSAEEFDLDTVIIPVFSAVVDIAQDKFPREDVDELEGVNW